MASPALPLMMPFAYPRATVVAEESEPSTMTWTRGVPPVASAVP